MLIGSSGSGVTGELLQIDLKVADTKRKKEVDMEKKKGEPGQGMYAWLS